MRNKILTILILFCAVSAFAEIIGPTRKITWQGYVGVRGGIPTGQTIYTNLVPGGGDDSVQINNAKNNCPSNQVIYLGFGTFNISNSIIMDKDGVILRGRGPTNTILKAWDNSTYGQIVIGKAGGANQHLSDASITASAISGTPAKGDTNVVLVTPGNVSVGNAYLIMHSNDIDVSGTNVEGDVTAGYSIYPGNYWRGQTVFVTNIASSTASFATPLMFPFTNSPKMVKLIDQPRYRIGVEDLTIDTSPSSSTALNCIVMEAAINCWAKNITMIAPPKDAILIWYSYGCEVRHCSLYGNGTLYGAGGGYGIALYYGAGDCLIEDNISSKMHASFECNYYCSGNVFSYNFETNGVSSSGSSPSFGTHGVHTMFNLVEGNWFYDMILFDYTHGSGGQGTVFRNVIRGYDGSPAWLNNPVNIQNHQRHINFVGNILGRSGFSTNYIYNTLNSFGGGDDNLYGVFLIGPYGGGTGQNESQVLSDPLIHLNYTTATATNSGIQVDLSNGDNVLGNSYLYASSPPIFTTPGLSWPPYSPSNVTAAAQSPTNIPAGYRFVYGVDPANSGNPTVSITTPTSSSSYSTSSSGISIAGTAADDVSVSSVTASMSGATSGSISISGTTSWSGSTTLNSGVTVITVTDTDNASNTGQATLTVTYTPGGGGGGNGNSPGVGSVNIINVGTAIFK